MSILDTFFILFESDASKLDDGLKESEKKAGSFLDKLRKVDAEAAKTGGTFRDLIGKLGAFAGVGLSVGALIASVRTTAAEYTALQRLALQFRATVDEIDEFRDAAGLLGISNEHSTESLHALERAVQDTAMGLGRAKMVFEELGIEVKDGQGNIKSTTAVMGELAEKFKGMDQGKQVRVMERLGLDPALLKLFNSDLAALQKRMADVDRAANFNLGTAVKRAAEYTKASKELSIELNTLKLYLSKLAEGFKIASLPWFTKAMGVATEYVQKFVAFLMRHSHFVEGFMIAAGAAISYYLIPAAIRGAIAVWAMIAPFALVGLAVAALATLFALLYDDVVNFMEGNDSLIGDLLQKYPQLADAAKGIGAAFMFVFDIARALFTFMLRMWDAPGDAFTEFQADLMDGLNALFDAFPGLKEGFDAVMDGVTVAGRAIVDVWDVVVAAVRLAIGAIVAGVEGVIGIVNKVKGAFGLGGTPTAEAAAQGQRTLAQAGASPLASATSSSISNSATRGGDKNVSVGKVEVHTQATDAKGVAGAIGGALGSQLRQASSQFDDGVAA